MNNSAAKPFWEEDKFQWFIVFSCTLIFLGFVCSRVLVSIGMAALIISSLLHNGIGPSLRNYFQKVELWILSFYFLIVFVSGIYSADKMEWLNWVRIKLPYLVLPISFASTRRLTEEKFIVTLYSYLFIFFVSVLVVLGNYFLNYQAITESFLRGNGIPMPYSHIRYTLMLAFGFFCSYYLFRERKFVWNKNERWAQLSFMLFAFIALHILSVRSSLIALYLGIAVVIMKYALERQRILAGGLLLALMISISWLAVRYVPSLHNKWSYMQYDVHQFRKGEISNLSDGARLISMQGAFDIGRKNLLLGVGAGDLKGNMQNFYEQKYPDLPLTDRKMPHNQFGWVFASTGMVGLALFLMAFSLPLFRNKHYKFWPFLVLHLILLSSFFTEATLEEQMGTGFFLVFLLLFLNHMKDE